MAAQKFTNFGKFLKKFMLIWQRSQYNLTKLFWMKLKTIKGYWSHCTDKNLNELFGHPNIWRIRRVILERNTSSFWQVKHQALLKAKCKPCGFIYSFKSLHLSSAIYQSLLGSRCTVINVSSLLSSSTSSDGKNDFKT